MSITREVPAAQWSEFLPRFSERNQGRPVRLEAAVRPGEGPPLLAEHSTLIGIELDPKGSAAPAIEVILGGSDPRQPEFTHLIESPTHLWIEEDPDGLGRAVQIESREEDRTRVIFEAVEALSDGQ